MKTASARYQTFFLTGINVVVRAIGLVMRIAVSRIMGAEIMGIVELAQGVHMVAITPLTSGVPVAISRMTARANAADKTKPLVAGLYLARKASLLLIPALWLFSPWIAKLLGDVRVLPSLWLSAPCILILGYSAAYNGYSYGMGLGIYPALSELIEQVGRFFLTIILLYLFQELTAPWFAAIPMLATMLAEMIGILFVLRFLPKQSSFSHATMREWLNHLLRLATPTTAARLFQTFLRSATSILIPLRLQSSGLCTAEATAQLGMLNGMVMPLLMLPCVFTNALSMVALPKIAQAEENPHDLKRILTLCCGSCLPVSVFSAALIWATAPFLASLYRQSELSRLFRLCAPLTILFAFSHIFGSFLTALGQQKRSLYVSIAVSLFSLILTWYWTSVPALRIRGVIWANYLSQSCLILGCIGVLMLWKKEKRYER